MPFDGTKLDEATKLLINARERIITNGWCQGRLTNGYGAFCMLGAIDYKEDTLDSVRKEAIFRLELLVENIPYWNDKPGRTKEEVIAAFDFAIANGE